jgi:hypothetical protein
MTDDYTRAAVAAMTRAVDSGRDFAEWLAAALAAVAAAKGSMAALTEARSGSWEAGHVDRLVRGTVGDDADLPGWAAPAPAPHEHARHGVGAHRAVLRVARAVLAQDAEGAALATLSAPCPVCEVISAVQFGFTLATSEAGEPYVTEALRLRFLAVIDAAQRKLDAGEN